MKSEIVVGKWLCASSLLEAILREGRLPMGMFQMHLRCQCDEWTKRKSSALPVRGRWKALLHGCRCQHSAAERARIFQKRLQRSLQARIEQVQQPLQL